MQYTVQGQRSELSGPVSDVFTVNFGRLPSGMRTASVATGGVRDGNLAPAETYSGHSASGATQSTVNGRAVQKTLPGNGQAAPQRM